MSDYDSTEDRQRAEAIIQTVVDAKGWPDEITTYLFDILWSQGIAEVAEYLDSVLSVSEKYGETASKLAAALWSMLGEYTGYTWEESIEDLAEDISEDVEVFTDAIEAVSEVPWQVYAFGLAVVAAVLWKLR